MIRAEVCDLITVSPEAAGVGTEPEETRRTVFCTLKSIGQQEAYMAFSQGLNPEVKVVLAHDFEYQGERLCELGGVRYDILRTYVTETDGIELTLQRVARNAKPVPTTEGGELTLQRVQRNAKPVPTTEGGELTLQRVQRNAKPVPTKGVS